MSPKDGLNEDNQNSREVSGKNITEKKLALATQGHMLSLDVLHHLLHWIKQPREEPHGDEANKVSML